MNSRILLADLKYIHYASDWMQEMILILVKTITDLYLERLMLPAMVNLQLQPGKKNMVAEKCETRTKSIHKKLSLYNVKNW